MEPSGSAERLITDPDHSMSDRGSQQTSNSPSCWKKILNFLTDPEQAKSARSHSVYYVTGNVTFCIAIMVLKLCEEDHLYDGGLAEVVIMMFYYLPSIIFCFVAFAFFPENHKPLGSTCLRALHTVISIVFVGFNVVYILVCADEFFVGCSEWIIIQRAVVSLFFLGLLLYVKYNHRYPRSNIIHFAGHLHLCSAAIFTYLLQLIEEERHIYLKIFNHTALYESESNSPFAKRIDFSSEHSSVCDSLGFWNYLKCLREEYAVMIGSVTLESLVVSSSIIIAIISAVGENEELPHGTQLNARVAQNMPPEAVALKKKRQCFWYGIIFLAVLVQFVVIMFNIWKAEPENWIAKAIYTATHCLILAVGICACIYFLWKGYAPSGHNGALEILDNKLLIFGTIGIFSYISFGLVYSYTLFYTNIKLRNAIFCMFIYIFSLLEVLIQTITMQNRDIANSSHVFGAAIVLWFVNFVMFALDLFDAATYGQYATPILDGSNKYFALFVRGLGPFNVFYRFHSLSLIAESVENHIDPLRKEQRL